MDGVNRVLSELTPEVWMLPEDRDGGRFRIGRKGRLVGRKRSRQHAGLSLPLVAF
jgi:hypothetical protein